MSKIRTLKVTDPISRQKVLQVIDTVFHKEKKWLDSAEDQVPEDIASNERMSWFLAICNGEPAGALRLFYDPPLELPEEYGVTLKKDFNLEEFAENGRFVEVGRFMILPEYRRRVMVALRLMRAAVNEVVTRDYTHFITDVYEGERHSPFNFHTRILGFEVIGRHLYGELKCSYTRIILTLDILKAYKLQKQKNSRIYRFILSDIRGRLDHKLTMMENPGD